MTGEEGKELRNRLELSPTSIQCGSNTGRGSRLFRDRHSFPRCLALVGVSHDISALSALNLGIKAGTTHHSTKRRTPFVSVGTKRTDEKERVERLLKDDGGRRGKAADDTVHCRFAVRPTSSLTATDATGFCDHLHRRGDNGTGSKPSLTSQHGTAHSNGSPLSFPCNSFATSPQLLF